MKQTIIQAVAGVLVADGRILVVRRQPHLKAFPGYHAFPGGKVDAGDGTLAPSAPIFTAHPGEHMGALCRELHEELGLDLPSLAAAACIHSVQPVGLATTPPLQPLRFQTTFYRIHLAEMPDFHLDQAELVAAHWMHPDEIHGALDHGRMLAVPPVAALLRQLADDPHAASYDAIDFQYDADRNVPCLPVVKDVWMLPVRSQTLPPADRTNAFLIGGFLVDPSPCDLAEMERLLHTLKGFSVQGIFLTHHHPDHYQFTDHIAKELELPIHLSRDTRERICKHRGHDYFAGLELVCRSDGDQLTTWLDQPVRCYAVPGHDAGQLALAPDNQAWFLVGDLIQGIGTVVIAAPEGNMAQYFASLARVIELDPAIIMPSHGLAMGTTYRLQATLAHRRKREAEVMSLAQAGQTRQAMLRNIYPDLDERLIPLALANIESHLTKLVSEGRLPPLRQNGRS